MISLRSLETVSSTSNRRDSSFYSWKSSQSLRNRCETLFDVLISRWLLIAAKWLLGIGRSHRRWFHVVSEQFHTKLPWLRKRARTRSSDRSDKWVLNESQWFQAKSRWQFLQFLTVLGKSCFHGSWLASWSVERRARPTSRIDKLKTDRDHCLWFRQGSCSMLNKLCL